MFGGDDPEEIPFAVPQLEIIPALLICLYEGLWEAST